ncbi:MAG: sulfatase-like hydrolase/transferase [Terriglobales bacterium]
MRTWLPILSRAVWGIYLILTSVYCLLAFLPYTYVALIKEPPYAWMPWFAVHHAALYLLALTGLAATHWPNEKRFEFLMMLGVLAAAGIGLWLRPFLPNIQNNQTAFWWSLTALIPLTLVAGFALRRDGKATKSKTAEMFSYSNAVVIAVLVTLIYGLAAQVHTYAERASLQLDRRWLELSLWSLISHALLAILTVSAFNLIRLASQRTRYPRQVELAATGALGFAFLWATLSRFLGSAFSFEGWEAQLYAASLAMALILWIAWLASPPVHSTEPSSGHRKFGLAAVVLTMSAFAVVLPTMVTGSDWNGVLQNTFAVIFWAVLSVCIYRLRPRRTSYSMVAMLAVVFFAGFGYKALQATEILWARPLGATDDEVARAMDNYAAGDASFQLVHHILGNGREEACGDLCRILRENTNVRDAEAVRDLQLVDPLVPSRVPHPNIFIFVIDSLRQDYVGAYNPKVDFTPNLDAFASDSVVIHNIYTQYAGTSLSEPAIWAGAMLLHAHYLQPFARLNSLEKLARVDGYQMVLSDDEILRQLLSPTDNLLKLDTDKKLWNQLEVCSTIRQTETLLDGGLGEKQPILFYTQPKNVHQFARNDLPMMNSENWRLRTGFSNRIAYEVHQVDGCLGGFFAFLKTHGLYDNSIVIVTADHGDATGEFGRFSHSLSIFPEVMRVPLIIHLPTGMRHKVVYDDTHLSSLTDITPSLYYLLGHRPIVANRLFGHPLFAESREELEPYQRNELFLASDERAVYGLLTDNGRYLYTTYDSPARSYLFDLEHDPNALHNLIATSVERSYDSQIIDYLHQIADFYGYKPGVGSLLAAR